MLWLIIIGVIAVLLFLRFKVFKIPKCGNMTLVTGGIKTGKSTMSVHLAVKTYRRNRRKVVFANFFRRLFRRPTVEMPLLYSNIPLAVPYVPLTLDLLERKERFRYKSVAYVCEASLVAGSMDYKDGELNDQLLLLNKLFAHETKGGSIFYDTQSISDNHFAVKRCLSTYFYIHHTVKIPFFCLMWLREMKFSEDNSTMNTLDSDVEESLKLYIVPKRVWKYFDCYCYSVLTDSLPVNDKLITLGRKPRFVKRSKLKAHNIISFKPNFRKECITDENKE